MKQYASIFNDVLGPVMSGPSSSHTAASVRLGNLMRQMLPGKPKRFTVLFDPAGALAPCYHEQWADAGLAAGLLGMLPDDSRLSQSLELAEKEHLELNFLIQPYPNSHPNTYQMTLENEEGECVSATGLSVGGGMIELIRIQGDPVSITGGFYETMLWGDCRTQEYGNEKTEALRKQIPIHCHILFQWKSSSLEGFWQIRSEQPVDKDVLSRIEETFRIRETRCLSPILPITSQLSPRVPFLSGDELLTLAGQQNRALWQMALWYESVRGGIREEDVFEKMRILVRTMKQSLDTGLKGTFYEKRILGCQSQYLSRPEIQNRLIPDNMTNEIIKCVSALMEVKSSMGIFVAAPTAGSCGCLPGTVLAVAGYLNLSEEEIVKGMLAAGMIGVFLSEKATFAAELAGCQAECGSGSGMTAAALVQLLDGSAKEACVAASMALQNVFGMTCDPVAMAVEVPCLGKNIMAGVNALTCANMSLAGFDPVISLDETIEAFNQAGRLLPPALRCTGGAGLTQTPTSKEIEKKLNK